MHHEVAMTTNHDPYLQSGVWSDPSSNTTIATIEPDISVGTSHNCLRAEEGDDSNSYWVQLTYNKVRRAGRKAVDIYMVWYVTEELTIKLRSDIQRSRERKETRETRKRKDEKIRDVHPI